MRDCNQIMYKFHELLTEADTGVHEEFWSFSNTLFSAANNSQWLVITSHFSVSPAICINKCIIICIAINTFYNVCKSILFKITLHTFKYNFWNTFISYKGSFWTELVWAVANVVISCMINWWDLQKKLFSVVTVVSNSHFIFLLVAC